MSTMIALARADSLAPRSSSSAAHADQDDGRQVDDARVLGQQPVAQGVRQVKSKKSSSSSLKYSAQPTEVAAPATPYSKIRHQPTM